MQTTQVRPTWFLGDVQYGGTYGWKRGSVRVRRTMEGTVGSI